MIHSLLGLVPKLSRFLPCQLHNTTIHLDASSHLYKRVCLWVGPSVGRSVRPLRVLENRSFRNFSATRMSPSRLYDFVTAFLLLPLGPTRLKTGKTSCCRFPPGNKTAYVVLTILTIKFDKNKQPSANNKTNTWLFDSIEIIGDIKTAKIKR